MHQCHCFCSWLFTARTHDKKTRTSAGHPNKYLCDRDHDGGSDRDRDRDRESGKALNISQIIVELVESL
jgi:hypothetical protein